MPFNVSKKFDGFYVGVELELEDNTTCFPSRVDWIGSEEQSLWNIEMDGSLRYGAELISVPIPYPSTVFDRAMDQLDKLHNRFPHATVGRRTSMHIHVNVSDMSTEQFRSFMYLSLCLEPVLMRYCADHRQESNFCAPSYHSINQVPVLAKLFHTEGASDKFDRDILPKYAAIGLYRLFDLGTVEFRMFEGTLSDRQVEAAVKLLHSVWEQSLTSTVEQLTDRKRQQGVVSLLTPLLREVAGKFINQHDIELTIERGVKMANDMVRAEMTMEDVKTIHEKLFPTNVEEVVDTVTHTFPIIEGLDEDMSIVWGYCMMDSFDSIAPPELVKSGRVLGKSLEVPNFNRYVGVAINTLGMDNSQETYEWVFDKLFNLAKYFEQNCNTLIGSNQGTSVDMSSIYQYRV